MKQLIPKFRSFFFGATKMQGFARLEHTSTLQCLGFNVATEVPGKAFSSVDALSSVVHKTAHLGVVVVVVPPSGMETAFRDMISGSIAVVGYGLGKNDRA